AGSLLVDQLSLSLLTHFAETYGGMRAGKAEETGRLAA
ncbi:AraC family transcriptional regulator, partial [Amaricoccus sp. HAR-UPW-R2A-40]